MSTYKFKKTKTGIELKTKKNKVVLTQKNSHIHVKITRKYPKKNKQGLTHVRADLTVFELKAMAFYVLNTNNLDCNYAKIFVSCFN